MSTTSEQQRTSLFWTLFSPLFPLNRMHWDDNGTGGAAKRALLRDVKLSRAAGYFYTMSKPPTPSHRRWNGLWAGLLLSHYTEGILGNCSLGKGAHIVQNTSHKTTQSRNTSRVTCVFSFLSSCHQ